MFLLFSIVLSQWPASLHGPCSAVKRRLICQTLWNVAGLRNKKMMASLTGMQNEQQSAREFQYPAGIKPVTWLKSGWLTAIMCNSPKPPSYWFVWFYEEKTIYELSYLATFKLTQIWSPWFSVSDSSSHIDRSDKIHQNVYSLSKIRQPGAWALEKSLTRPSLFLYFREIRKKRSHWPDGQSAPWLYNRYNLCLCARPAHVGECGPGPEFKFSKTVQVGWSC